MISLFPSVSSVTLDWVLAKLFSVGAAAANCWGSRLQNEKGFRGGVSCDTEGAPPSFHDALRFFQVSDGRTSDALRLYCNRIFFFSGKIGTHCMMLLLHVINPKQKIAHLSLGLQPLASDLLCLPCLDKDKAAARWSHRDKHTPWMWELYISKSNNAGNRHKG